MRKTVAEIAHIVGGELIGDGEAIVTNLSGIQTAREGDLTFVADKKYLAFAKQSEATAIILSRHMRLPGKNVILTDNPSFAFSQIVSLFSETRKSHPKGIHKTAIIASEVQLGKDVAIGPYVVIERHVKIGEGTVIYAGSYLGAGAEIGRECLIFPHVTIYSGVKIAHHVVIHSGTVIGCDGFGFTQVKGTHRKIPQIGTVRIEDDVEIGANVTIDRARFDETVVGRGTKIDNLVQIGHNVVLGKNCIVVSQVGIAGSVLIEDDVILAGQAGVAGHLKLGRGSVVTAQTAVMKSVAPRSKVMGTPARPYQEVLKSQALLRQLPRYRKEIQQLKRRIEDLEQKTANHSR